MADQFNYDVFLSHSVKDKPIVRELAEQLRKDGLRVWLDEWVLKPGDHVQAKIEEGLDQSRVLVLCMSANAFGSDWAQLEAGTFRFRDPMNRERRFIPLSKTRWRDRRTSNVLAPFALSRKQCIFLRADDRQIFTRQLANERSSYDGKHLHADLHSGRLCGAR